MALEDARHTVADLLPLVNDVGLPLHVEHYDDFSGGVTPILEEPGELYMRRCTMALWEAALETTHRPGVPYTVTPEGMVHLQSRKEQ